MSRECPRNGQVGCQGTIAFGSYKDGAECKITDCPLKTKLDFVNHPPHYTSHPSGVECIQITEHMGFNLGNAIKYIWRADEKGQAITDLEKAAWYVNREIEKRKKQLSLVKSA